MRVAIIGSRDCHSLGAEAVLAYLPEECSRIVSGGAAGVDSVARQAANLRGIPFQEFLPDYKKHGKNAPLIRNGQIVAGADLVLAFWDFASRGTAHAIASCIRQGVPVRVIGLDECGADS